MESVDAYIACPAAQLSRRRSRESFDKREHLHLISCYSHFSISRVGGIQHASVHHQLLPSTVGGYNPDPVIFADPSANRSPAYFHVWERGRVNTAS